MSKNGLKLKETPKSEGQKTLEEAFDAGKLYQAAQSVKEQVLQGKKRRFMVNHNYWLLVIIICDINLGFSRAFKSVT